MNTGTVKFFNTIRGFGFITQDDGKPDVFFHVSALRQEDRTEIETGTRVSFETELTHRGTQAKNVRVEEMQG